MAQSGFTPIITYNTATAAAAPTAPNLVQGELAVNVTDKKIYTKDSGGAVVQVGSGPSATETLTNKTLTSPDINGGTLDGAVVGGATPAAGSFTSLNSGPIAGFRNRLINGDMRVSQRGTSLTVSTGVTAPFYTLDRWYTNTNGYSVTVTQNVGAGTGRTRMVITNGASGETNVYLGQRIEVRNTAGLPLSTVTVSGYFYSSSADTMTWNAYRNTVDDTFGNIGSGTLIATGTFNLTTDIRHSASFTIPSTAICGIEIQFVYPLATSANLVAYDIQLEVGSVATPFEARPYGTELALCQRYYQELGRDGIYAVMFGGYQLAATATSTSFVLPVQMRVNPTGALVGTWAVSNCGQPSFNSLTKSSISLATTVTATGVYYYHSSTTYYLTLTAEL